jgi:hypothetical protein
LDRAVVGYSIKACAADRWTLIGWLPTTAGPAA